MFVKKYLTHASSSDNIFKIFPNVSPLASTSYPENAKSFGLYKFSDNLLTNKYLVWKTQLPSIPLNEGLKS